MLFLPRTIWRLSHANIVVDGNSISAWSDATAFGRWSDRLKQLPPYSAPTCTVTNIAIPGRSTWVLATKAPWEVDPLLRPGRPNICIIWEVLNDLSLFPSDPLRVAQNLRTYCLARRAAGWKTVVFGLQNARIASGGITSQSAFDAARPLVNAWLRDNWRSFADAWVDPSLSTKLNRALTADVPDGIHPSSLTLNEVIPLVDVALRSIAPP